MSTTGITPGGCVYCGAYWHSGMCPRIASIEYHSNGQVAKVTLRDSSAPPLRVINVSGETTIESGSTQKGNQ